MCEKLILVIKNIVFFVIIFSSVWQAKGQIPYFASTVGHQKVYGYTSLKVRPGIETVESYSTFQYGLGKYFATGVDIYTNGNAAYYGFLLRAGKAFSPYFQVGLQLTPSFDLKNKFGFSYLTAALYLNGNISRDGSLFWVSNTWAGINRQSTNDYNQWFYLGYGWNVGKERTLTPMLGCIYSWRFDVDPDMAIGAYYTFRKFNLYLWCDKIFDRHPRIVAGIDFTI